MPMQATGVNLCTKYVGPLHDPGVPTRPTVKLVSCPLDILRSQTAMKKPMIAFMFMRKKHQQLMMGAYFFCFSVWGTFPCYLLHFEAKTCTLLNVGAKICHLHCSLIVEAQSCGV
jgi:hypothetical protein